MMEPIRHIAATRPRGSALILTVVLTSLLAIVGVLFVLGARIDKMATTATTENRELACAIDTVLAQINQALIDDLPGVTTGQEYYDAPDPQNPWLAELEPYAGEVGKDKDGNPQYEYRWRQISNLVGPSIARTTDMKIELVGERDRIEPDLAASPDETTADADGDGVGDARWFKVPGVMTSKGKPFYAAVRIIDNGGMLNLNTGFKFDPEQSRVDANSLLQVNILALAGAPGVAAPSGAETLLLGTRAKGAASPVVAANLAAYEQEVIWQYLDVKDAAADQPSPYTPFDMSDELELRYRYLLNHATNTRVEDWGWFKPNTILSTPVDEPDGVNTWFPRVSDAADPSYAYRHVATTYNMDRILTPKPVELDDGTQRRKMVNVNTTDELTLRSAIAAALSETNPSADPMEIAQTAAQITANLRDYIDDDDEITVIPGLSSPYYGFERPCIYISEIACRQVRDDAGVVHSSYAIELYRPYFEDRDPRADEWKLVIDNPSSTTNIELSITWSGSRRFHVILAEDPQALLSDKHIVFTDAEEPANTMPLYAYNRSDYPGKPQELDPSWFKFEAGAAITLERSVPGGVKAPTVDLTRVPDGWMKIDGTAYSLQRDISPHKCIRRLWASAAQVSTPGLGNAVGNYVDLQRPEIIQAHPANRPLTSIGELGRIFRENAYISEGKFEADVLIDLANPAYSSLFNYLTVVDPSRYPWLGAGETRIMGRINVNTAPAFVLAQLPWLSYEGVNDSDSPAGGAARSNPTGSGAGASLSSATALQRGQEIVRHRELQGPYRSTGDLMQVAALHALALDKAGNGRNDTPRGPDLTPDTALNDFEERDLLFTRISDLITVRSDVFTAYVLVRVGVAGPQKRLIMTFDRSRVDSAGGRVRILAYHPVPDPR